MSITAVAPFGGASDQTLSVAYLSVFLLVFFVSFRGCVIRTIC
jgi:auxin efflux carrier family protein